MKDLQKIALGLVFVVLALAAKTERETVLEGQIIYLMNHISGKNVAMLTNPTSVDGKMVPIFERIIFLSKLYNVTIKCFFAPEHGLRGDHQDGVGDEDYIDP